MCHIQLVVTWVLSKMIKDLISECRRIYSRLKFSGRTDYFYQCCKESNCPVLRPLRHLSCPSLGPKPNVNFLFPTSVLVHAGTPADNFSVLLSTVVPSGELLFYCSPRAKPESKNIYILPIYGCYKRRKYELFKFNFFM